MKYLLDTQAFIWMTDRPERLTPTAADALADAGNDLLVSHVSAWEMQIKHGLGKLRLSVDPLTMARREADANSVMLLPITLDHIAGLSRLPPIHRDPFDRLLIAQARHEGLTVVTADEEIPKYTVPTLWE